MFSPLHRWCCLVEWTLFHEPLLLGVNPPFIIIIVSIKTIIIIIMIFTMMMMMARYNQRGMLVADKYPASSNATHHSLRSSLLISFIKN